MAYVKNIWVDQDVERPKTYEVTNNEDGSITLTDSFGLVTELGTPVNEVNMNHIEDGIDGCAIRKHNLTETFNLGEWVLGGTGDDEGIYKSIIANNVGNAITDDTKWEKVEMGGGSSRNIGEVVLSTIPLADAGLHLLDGALISGSGSYSAFVDYMADLYDTITPVETNFIQPILSANGTVGGDEFACAASSTYDSSNYSAWKAFEGDLSGGGKWVSGTTGDKWLEFYSPEALKVTNLKIYNHENSSYYLTSGTIQASTDGSTWTDLTTFTKSGWESYINIDLSSNTNYYKYYRLANLTSNLNAEVWVREVQITATYMAKPCFCTEAEWQTSVSTYGVCGKFVYDSVNNTVRLPKYSDKIYTKDITLTAPVMGNNKTLGFTDGTTNFGVAPLNSSPLGAFRSSNNTYGTSVGTTADSQGTINGKTIGITIDGNNSGIIADLSNITTALEGYWYIVIATSAKTDIQVDIDEIATDLNGKADVDLSNMNASQSAKNSIVGWAMPDFSAGVTFSTAITLPCDALVFAQVNGGGSFIGSQFTIDSINFINTSSYSSNVCSYAPKGSVVTPGANGGCMYFPLKGVN